MNFMMKMIANTRRGAEIPKKSYFVIFTFFYEDRIFFATLRSSREKKILQKEGTQCFKLKHCVPCSTTASF